MKISMVASAAILSVACAPSKAPERRMAAEYEDGIQATGVTIDVPWGSDRLRVRAGQARLLERSDTLELAGDVRFEWSGRVSGRAHRAAIDIRAKNLSLEGGVRASFDLDEGMQEGAPR